MNLRCAVCGTSRVTRTVETQDGAEALCDGCHEAVAETARKVAAKEAAAYRLQFRALGREP